MKYFSLFTIGLITLTLGTTSAFAQKRLADPRPLDGLLLDGVTIVPSIRDALRGGNPGDLTSRADVVGVATREVIATSPMIELNQKPFSGDLLTPRLGRLRTERAPNGTIRWMAGNFGRTETFGGTISSALHPEQRELPRAALSGLGVLQTYHSALGLNNPVAEMRLDTIVNDGLGFQHVRFEQIYDGVPVWGRDLFVHTNPRGEVYLINGSYEKTPTAVAMIDRVGDASALQIVIDDLKSRKQWAPLPDDAAAIIGFEAPTVRLVLYPGGLDGSMRLAYEVSLHPNLLAWSLYVVDAASGSILNRFDKGCSASQHHHIEDASRIRVSGFRDHEPKSNGTALSSAAGFVDASANDLNGVSGSFRAFRHDDGTFYSIWDLANYDAGRSNLPNQQEGGAVTISANNADLKQGTELFYVTSNDNAWSDPAGVSAHINMSKAYDYYRNTFSRKAIDGRDGKLVSVVHVTEDGQPMDNAFWNGQSMAYGDGSQQFKSLAGGLDVAGHEMTHGVIENTAGLIYQFQSGALNESFADVFGIMIDRDDFLMGDEIMKPGQGIALRDFANPDNPQIGSPQPAHMNQFRDLTAEQDNGGVHINSGIPNRAAFLVIQAIGHTKTEQIYYRAISNYLGRNSQFIDCRNACEQSAKDLFGDGAEAAAVRDAFTAVGIGSGGGTDGGDNDVPPVNGGKSVVAFILADGRIGYLDVTTGESVVFNHQDAIARVDNSIDNRTQLSTPLNGERIWFVNQNRKLAFITISTGVVSVFNNLSIQKEGDIWNASVSPDEEFVAMASAYANDPNLYFTDGTTITATPLKPESTQEGIEIESIRYPDVISWSPNHEIPRVAFDAYNEIDLGGVTVDYWDIYEMDFDNGKIYSFLPQQSEDVSVGNVTYSYTNPDRIAFNVIEEGRWDVYTADYETGDIVSLGLQNFTVNSQSVLDAQRPTYSPDDQFICTTSPTLQALLFYALPTGQLSFVNMPAVVYNPHWFVIGGVVPSMGVESAVESGVTLSDAVPNPFSTSTQVRYELRQSADIELQVIDLMGRTVATLAEGHREAGAYVARIEAGAFPAGAYVIRLKAGDLFESKIVTLMR